MTSGPVTVEHVPVLVDAVARLARARRRIVDGTVGGGGHAARFVALGARVLAVDRDPEALARGRDRLGGERVEYLHGRFADPDILAAVQAFAPDMVLLDLGVSSMQLETDARGFSFRPGVPLDMRMGGSGPSAAELLQRASPRELRELFRRYGDERRADRLARDIARRRKRTPMTTSDDLVGAIRSALGPRTGPKVFARLFQAVRIAVNDELAELERGLPGFRDALVPGGILAVISYHSGEDRIVKHQFAEWARSCVCPPKQPVCTCRGRALGRVDPRRPVTPAADELAMNPRARSAKLRVFRKAGGA